MNCIDRPHTASTLYSGVKGIVSDILRRTAMFPGAGTGKFKPFDVLAKQFSNVAESYKKAESKEQRRQLLAVMRLILDEADSLQRFYESQDADSPDHFFQWPER